MDNVLAGLLGMKRLVFAGWKEFNDYCLDPNNRESVKSKDTAYKKVLWARCEFDVIAEELVRRARKLGRLDQLMNMEVD